MKIRAKVMPIAVAGAALLLPSLALADVIEIGADGYHWKTGAPTSAVGDPTALVALTDNSQQAPLPGVPDETGLAPQSASDLIVEPGSLTQVADAAGPARWRLTVAALAAKYDISPSLLEAVVWQESRWNEGAVSPVGARGLAQLMPGTAAHLGVNAADPIANLEGGARYLRLQLDAFGGNIEKALAAYNAGPERVKKAGGIPNIRETQAYVASIMARLSTPVQR